MFLFENGSFDTIELRGVIYNGSQDEIHVARNSPFNYGHFFFVGGVRYELVETTNSEYVYNAKR